MSMTCSLTLMTGDKSKSSINKCFEGAGVVIDVQAGRLAVHHKQYLC